MKRQTFLTIAAVISVLFAAFMLAAPAKMMESLGSLPSDSANVLLQVVSVMLFCIGIITFLARKDEGSIALRAIMIGSLVMHIISIPIDWIAFNQGIFTKMSGFLPGTIIHVVFAFGFYVYLMRLPKK